MCMNNIKNKLKYTNTLCRITVLWIYCCLFFGYNVRSLATDFLCLFVHYLCSSLDLDRTLSRYLTFLSPSKIFFQICRFFNMSSLFPDFFHFYDHLLTLVPWYTFSCIYITLFIIEYS